MEACCGRMSKVPVVWEDDTSDAVPAKGTDVADLEADSGRGATTGSDGSGTASQDGAQRRGRRQSYVGAEADPSRIRTGPVAGRGDVPFTHVFAQHTLVAQTLQKRIETCVLGVQSVQVPQVQAVENRCRLQNIDEITKIKLPLKAPSRSRQESAVQGVTRLPSLLALASRQDESGLELVAGNSALGTRLLLTCTKKSFRPLETRVQARRSHCTLSGSGSRADHQQRQLAVRRKSWQTVESTALGPFSRAALDASGTRKTGRTPSADGRQDSHNRTCVREGASVPRSPKWQSSTKSGQARSERKVWKKKI